MTSECCRITYGLMGKIGVFRQLSFIDLRIHTLTFDSTFQLFFVPVFVERPLVVYS